MPAIAEIGRHRIESPSGKPKYYPFLYPRFEPPQPPRAVVPDLDHLPFDQKWAVAENWPLAYQVAFITEEVSHLVGLAGRGEFSSDPAYEQAASFRQSLLTIDKERVKEGSLPQPIKDYFLNPPYPEKDGWENPKLWLRSWGRDREFYVSLGTYLQNGSIYDIDVLGIETQYEDWSTEMEAKIGPNWEFNDPDNPLRSTPSYQHYQELDKYIKEDGPFALTRELMRFAGDIIHPPVAVPSTRQ